MLVLLLAQVLVLVLVLVRVLGLGLLRVQQRVLVVPGLVPGLRRGTVAASVPPNFRRRVFATYSLSYCACVLALMKHRRLRTLPLALELAE